MCEAKEFPSMVALDLWLFLLGRDGVQLPAGNMSVVFQLERGLRFLAWIAGNCICGGKYALADVLAITFQWIAGSLPRR
jgi:hypothetical protein